jgi:hypothetical protein
MFGGFWDELDAGFATSHRVANEIRSNVQAKNIPDTFYEVCVGVMISVL